MATILCIEDEDPIRAVARGEPAAPNLANGIPSGVWNSVAEEAISQSFPVTVVSSLDVDADPTAQLVLSSSTRGSSDGSTSMTSSSVKLASKIFEILRKVESFDAVRLQASTEWTGLQADARPENVDPVPMFVDQVANRVVERLEETDNAGGKKIFGQATP